MSTDSLETVDLENPSLRTYRIDRVRCQGCSKKITQHLQTRIPTVGVITFEAESQQIEVQVPSSYVREHLQSILSEVGDYPLVVSHPNCLQRVRQGLVTFYPLLLILGYLTVPVLLWDDRHPEATATEAMHLWMGLFYLVFSFFKLLNWRGFIQTFRKYDYLAQVLPAYAFLYPVLEIALGFAYLTEYQVTSANAVTVAVFSENLVSVMASVWRGDQLDCACLGSLLNLPLSYVTITEDTLMIVMGILGLVYH